MQQYSSQIKGLIKGPPVAVTENQQMYFDDNAYSHIDQKDHKLPIKLTDRSSIWHLESYRSLLMSQLSRDELISSLKLVQ